MSPENYKEFLVSRVIEFNGYGTVEALLQAIGAASKLPPETEWRQRKHAFNMIADKAPLLPNRCYAITHEDLPGFLDDEIGAFKLSKQIRRCKREKERGSAKLSTVVTEALGNAKLESI